MPFALRSLGTIDDVAHSIPDLLSGRTHELGSSHFDPSSPDLEPNARHQARRAAGARHERTLEAVACPGRAGGCPTGPPTGPYVRLSLIRFLGAARFHTARWPDDSDHPRHPSPPALRHDAYVAIRSCRTGWASGSESLAPVLPWCGEDARRRLRCTRSHGRRWFPGFPASPPPARPSLPAGEAGRRSRARLSWKTVRPSLLCSAQTAYRPSGVPLRSRLSRRTCRPRVVLDGSTRRGGGPFLWELWSRGGLPAACSAPHCSAISRQEADEALTSSRVIPFPA